MTNTKTSELTKKQIIEKVHVLEGYGYQSWPSIHALNLEEVEKVELYQEEIENILKNNKLSSHLYSKRAQNNLKNYLNIEIEINPNFSLADPENYFGRPEILEGDLIIIPFWYISTKGNGWREERNHQVYRKVRAIKKEKIIFDGSITKQAQILLSNIKFNIDNLSNSVKIKICLPESEECLHPLFTNHQARFFEMPLDDKWGAWSRDYQKCLDYFAKYFNKKILQAAASSRAVHFYLEDSFLDESQIEVLKNHVKKEFLKCLNLYN